MANNYYDESVTLLDRNGQPAVLGKVGMLIVDSLTWYEPDKGIGHTAGDDCVMNDALAEAVIDLAGVTQDQVDRALGQMEVNCIDLRQALILAGEKYPLDFTPDMIEGTPCRQHDAGCCPESPSSLRDLMAAEPGSTLETIISNGAYSCSKPRHNEFGGVGTFHSSKFFYRECSDAVEWVGTAVHDALSRDDYNAAAEALATVFQGTIDGILDPLAKSVVKTLVIGHLSAGPDNYVVQQPTPQEYVDKDGYRYAEDGYVYCPD